MMGQLGSVNAVSVDEQAIPETGVRKRTRRAILESAVRVWARDFTAPLADIAERAGVSRSTLHRYFADRQALVDAVLVDATEVLVRAAEDATAHSTTAREELEALMRAIIDVGDVIIFLFADPRRFEGNEHWDGSEQDDGDLAEVVRRAQEEGAVTTDVDPAWVVGVFYSLVYVAAEAINSGHLPRHRAADVSLRTFFGGVAP